jgi:hypothetical protein
MTRRLGQGVVVDNRSSAAGTWVATEFARYRRIATEFNLAVD